MWPWGHLAVAYLALAGHEAWRDRRPSLPVTLAALFGSQLPDLIDKPLAWTLGVLPVGRSLAHSVVVLAPILAVALVLAGRRRRPVAAGAIGVASHLAADALGPALAGEVEYLTFLAWPLVEPPSYPVEQSFLAHLLALEVTGLFVLELLAVALAVGVWLVVRRDGAPSP